jgi:hypothetical protein
MKEPIFDYMTIVLNGAKFIEHCIKQYYSHANKIWIIEGADNRTRDHVNPKFFTLDGHSIDDTVEIVKSFPDPEHKINLIQHPNNTFWSGGKDEMITQINNRINVDRLDNYWLFEQDVDEFVRDEDIIKLKEIITEYPQITSFGLPAYNFWKSLNEQYGWDNKDTFTKANCDWGSYYVRLMAWKPGASHQTHRPPTLRYEDGTNSMRIMWAGAHLVPLDIWMYHLSDVFPEQVEMKSQYYEIEWWYRDTWQKWEANKEAILARGIYPLGGSGTVIPYNGGAYPREVIKLGKKYNLF